MSREPEVASMRNEDRFKEEGIPLLSYRWYAPIALNSNSIDNFLSRDNILFLFLENIVLYYGYSFLYFICRKLILDNQNLYRCETKGILKNSNSIDNTFWEIIVLYMHVPFGYTLCTENWYLQYYSYRKIIDPCSVKLSIERSTTFEKGRISGTICRAASRSINWFEATNDNQAHLSLEERNVSR